MLGLLARLFIKDYKNTKDSQVRSAYGVLSGLVGISLNFLLFLGKFVAGILSRSMAVMADAFNNLQDMIASIVTIVGFKISQKEADAGHPYGHGRMEYVAGLAVSFLILLFASELFRSSIRSIITPHDVDSSAFTLAMLLASIAVKFYMFIYNRGISKKISSVAMLATAKDSLNDTLSTFIVLLAIIVERLFPEVTFPFDAVAALVVSLFIFWSGIESVRDTINPLLGKPLDDEYIEDVLRAVKGYGKNIIAIHDVKYHDYGPGEVLITMHVEVPGDKNIFMLHELIDKIEKEVGRRFNSEITIHMDPIDETNPNLPVIKKYLEQESKEIDPEMSFHDIRMTGDKNTEHVNVIFDVVPSESFQKSHKELREFLGEKIKAFNPLYNAVVNIDSPYFNPKINKERQNESA